MAIQPPPATRAHLGRGSTGASARRARQRLRSAVDSAQGDVVNNDQTPTGGILTDQDGATITFDMSLYTKHQVTLGGNRTLAVTNVKYQNNQRFAIKLIQDGTGSRTVSWWGTIKWAGGSAPTLTTAAGKADWIGFVTTGNGTYDGMVIAQNL